MTLIVGGLFAGVMFQVSDRLLTIDRPVDIERWDDDSNKSVIVNLGDTMLFVGYSGTAFIEMRDGRASIQMPTDSWLAAACGGVQLYGDRLLAQTPILDGLTPEAFDTRLYEALEWLLTKLTRAQRQAFYLEVQVNGIRMQRNGRPRAIQFLYAIAPARWKGVRSRRRPNRTCWWAAGPGGTAPYPEVLCTPTSQQRRAASDLFRPETVRTVDSFRHALVDLVRDRAANNPTIGRDVMALQYDPRADPANIAVTHFPASGWRPAFVGELDGRVFAGPAFRTPWYLSRYGSMEPRESTALRISCGTDDLGEDPVGMDVGVSGRGGLPIVMGNRPLLRRPYDPRQRTGHDASSAIC